MLQTWVGSHENEPDYNGQQCGERNVRSIEAVPLYDQYGNANVGAFSDEAIAARSGNGKKPTKVSIKARILPQLTRLEKLQAEILELELAYKSGEVSPEDYTVLRNIAFAKKERAEILYKRAISVKPRSQLEDDTQFPDNSPLSCEEYAPITCANDKGDDGHRGEGFEGFLADLSADNMFKNFLQKACKRMRKAVHWSHKARSYWNELKAV